MKKAIILLVTVLGLLLVGCADDSASVGDTVRLVDPNGEYIDMYEKPGVTVISNWPPNHECEVVSGARTVADVEYLELECIEPAGYIWVGWVDVTKLEVLE